MGIHPVFDIRQFAQTLYGRFTHTCSADNCALIWFFRRSLLFFHHGLASGSKKYMRPSWENMEPEMEVRPSRPQAPPSLSHESHRQNAVRSIVEKLPKYFRQRENRIFADGTSCSSEVCRQYQPMGRSAATPLDRQPAKPGN